MQLITPTAMNEWFERTTGVATITYANSNQLAQLTAAGTDNSILYWPHYAYPGDTIRCTVMARVVSGNVGALIVDVPNGSQVEKILIDSPEWKRYSVNYTHPLKANVSEVSMGVGFGTPEDGVIEVTRPQMALLNGQGSKRLIADGVLQINEANTVEFLSSFQMFGFDEAGLIFNAGDITVPLSNPFDTNTASINGRFMPTVTTTADGWSNAAGPIHFGPFGVSSGDQSFKVVGYDSAGLKISDFTGLSTRYVHLQLFA